MLDRQELLELSQFKQQAQPVLSLYLRVDPQAVEPQHVIRFKNLCQALMERREEFGDQWPAIDADLDRMRDAVTRFTPRGQGVVIFAAGETLWKQTALPYEVPTDLSVGEKPRLRPLFRLLQRYDRYLAILTDSQRARLFLVTPEETTEVGTTEQDMSTTGHGTDEVWSEPRRERQREMHSLHHYKTAAEMAFNILQQRGFNGLILLGTEETTSAFRDVLHPYLERRMLATHAMPVDAPPHTVGEVVREIAHTTRRERQHRLLDEWEGGTRAPKGRATAGLEQTLLAAQQGQLMTLLLREDAEASGGRCQQCGSLLVEQSGACPFCSGPIAPLDDVLEALVVSAVEQDAEVIFLAADGDGPRLTPAGGVGAILRFTV